MLALIIALAIGQSSEDLVKKLGSDKFAERQEAQEELLKIMDFDMYVKFKTIKGSNLEVRRRLKVLIEDYEIKLFRNYEIDLRGYPKYPFIDVLPDGYKWNKMNGQEIVAKYLDCACKVQPYEGAPKWTHYRVATHIWVRDRIFAAFVESIDEAINEKDFRSKMTEALKPIQKDVDILIKGDDEYWAKQKLPNPLRILDCKKQK